MPYKEILSRPLRYGLARTHLMAVSGGWLDYAVAAGRVVTL